MGAHSDTIIDNKGVFAFLADGTPIFSHWILDEESKQDYSVPIFPSKI